MTETSVQAIVLALLSAGGATFVWTVFRSVHAWRNSAELREDKVIARLEKSESRCRGELECEREWSRYWQRWAATLEYELLIRSGSVPPRPTPPKPRKEDK